jgi:hypothetical protein
MRAERPAAERYGLSSRVVVIWVQCNALRRPAALRQSRVQVLRLPRVPYSEAGVFRLSRDGGLAAPSIIYKCEMVRLRDSKWEYGITFRRRIFPTAAKRMTRESAAALALALRPPAWRDANSSGTLQSGRHRFTVPIVVRRISFDDRDSQSTFGNADKLE